MSMETSFGNWIKRRRKALDLTQQELAQRVGCSLSLIFKIESDERRPSRQIAELLIKHLEIPPEQQSIFLMAARKEKATDTLGELPILYQPLSQSASPISLPSNTIVGREFEVAEITRLMQDPHCRLLTLTGQGGIGKTHLAIHTALSIADSKKHQVFSVSLAPITDREQSVTAIADALGIVLYAASDRAGQLISYLRDKEQLLILDNFEHLTNDTDCIDLISDILREAHKIKIIITSRQPLHLQAEWIFEVQGLPVPKSNRPDELETSSAVTLFLQRANQAAVGFKPTNDDLSAIVQICGLVEGLPLGIELAATWVRTLNCSEIANEIQKSIDFLATSVRDLPERHRSMRATIEHSWKLLTSNEQKVLRRLSTFRGGFTRQAAEFVASASLADLLALVSKSLIRRAESGRYDIHELIHHFAMDRLAQEGMEYDQTQMRHSQYYANLLEQRGPALKGADRPSVVSELISDLANLRQAWQWAIGHQKARDLCRSADTLFWLYESRSNCREGVPLYGKAVEGLQITEIAPSASGNWGRHLALGQALAYKGFFLFRQGQHPQGRDALKSSLAVLEEIPERNTREFQMAISNTVIFLGTVTSVMGDFMEGDRLLHKGLRMKQELGDLWGSAFCLRQIGLSAHYRGEYATSSETLEQSLAISREMGNTWAIAASLNQLGIVAHSRGKYDQARKSLTDGLELSRSLEDRASMAVALDGLGLVNAAQGQDEEAHALFQESIALWNEIGEQGSLAQTLIHYGDALLKMGNITGARNLFRDSLSIASEAQITPLLLEALIGEAEIRLANGEVESAFSRVWAVSKHSSSSYATRSRAEKLCADLEARLTPREIKNARAKTSTVESIVQEILTTVA